MALITPQPRIERDKVSFRLERNTAATLRRYAEWIQSSQEWVIGRALEDLFKRDREFQQWLRTRDTADAGPGETAATKEAR